MKQLLLIFFFLAPIVWAEPPQILLPFLKQNSKDTKPIELVHQDDHDTLSTDTNNDHKPDIFDEFDPEGALIIRKQDLNFDGKIDQITEFPQKPDDPKIIKTDLDHDGYFETTEEMSVKDGIISIVTKKDIQKTGEFKIVKKEFLLSKVAVQSETAGPFQCAGSPESRKQLASLQGLSEIIAGQGKLGALHGDYYETDLGFKIQKACVDTLGKENSLYLIQHSLQQGLSCEWALGTPNARANVHKMASLLSEKKNPPKLICDDSKFTDKMDANSKTNAHASVPGDPYHPAIVLNMAKIKNKKSEEFFGTIFHESTHLLGFLHGSGMEYAYTCQSCCFEIDSLTAKKIACKLCSGVYSSEKDKSYVTDLTAFFQASGRTEANFDYMLEYLKDSPRDRWARLHAATSNVGDLQTPAAVALAENFEKNFSPLTPAEKTAIADIKKHQNEAEVQLFVGNYRSIADSRIALIEGHPEQAEQNIGTYKQPVRPPNSSMSQAEFDYIKKQAEEDRKSAAWKIYFYHKAQGQDAKAHEIFLKYLSGDP